jgi:hypothetical protein
MAEATLADLDVGSGRVGRRLAEVVVLEVGAVVSHGGQARPFQPLGDVCRCPIEPRRRRVSPEELVGGEEFDVARELLGRDPLRRLARRGGEQRLLRTRGGADRAEYDHDRRDVREPLEPNSGAEARNMRDSGHRHLSG